jgi:hypothetical protein
MTYDRVKSTYILVSNIKCCNVTGLKEKVERDLKVLGVRRWRELVTDKKKWKDIVQQAKAHIGL